MQIKRNLYFFLLRKLENSIFFRIYEATNSHYQNFLFAGFKFFSNIGNSLADFCMKDNRASS